MLALAVDFGGTKVEAALVDETGRLLPGSRHRRPTGPAATSDELAAAVVAVARAARDAAPEPPAAVGMGSAGPIELARATVSPLNVPAWRGYPVAELLRRDLGLPVTLRMDGLAIALAEHWVGAAQGAESLMGMVVSTGVGGGILVGGRPVAGPSGNAGHVGHIRVSGFGDVPCVCGGVSCLEAVASGPNTVAWARGTGWRGETGEDLASAHAAGDPIAVLAVDRAGRAIGQAIASAAALLDLEVVAIGGGFSRVSPALFDAIRGEIAERGGFGYVRAVRVVPSGLSDEGPLIGAGALVHRS